MRIPVFLAVALLALAFVPTADAAQRCVLLRDGSQICVTVQGTCGSVDYVPPFTDSGAGAAACTTGSAGPAGVVACEEAIAGYVTIAGWHGAWARACATQYEDAGGRTCLHADAESNLFVLADLRPLCLSLA